MRNQYVLAIGELLVDAITAEQVENLSQAQRLHIHAGGSTANFCRYLKRCGTHAEIVAAVGKDGFGQILLDKLADDGISDRYVLRCDRHFTSLIIVARTAHTPDFIPYRDADKFIGAVDAQLLAGASWVHSTAFALSAEPARTHILAAFAQASSAQTGVSIDWNYSEKIWESHAEAQSVLTQVQLYRPALKFSLDDVSRYTGQAQLSAADARTFLNTLSASFICLTCGADGVYFKEQGGEWQFKKGEPIEVKNATGAGDSFWAGFIHARLNHADASAAIDHAIKTASLKLQGLLV